MLFEIFTILTIDFSYELIKNIFNLNHSNSSKWFYVHSLTNAIISYYSLYDIKQCISDISRCYFIEWNNYSYTVYKLSQLIHIYHSIFYKLKRNDYIHHILMCGIAGPLLYYQQSILSSLALFFLTGLPGMIDYFLLFMVKNKIIDSYTEKIIYIYISTWLRSPGCILTVALCIPGIKYNYYNDYLKLIGLIIMSSLVFWNGQYYLYCTYSDYYKKLIKYY